MKKIEFRGVEVEYDETCVKSWKWQKAINSGDSARGMKAISRLLLDKDEEVADQIGDDFEVMAELVAAIMDEINESKNSRSSLVPA